MSNNDFYDGTTNASWINSLWKIFFEEECKKDETIHACYMCQQSFYDIGVVQMLKGNEVVTVCHVCRQEGIKPKGRTRTRELHDLPPKLEPKYPKPKGPKHGYYDAALVAPLNCQCVWCHKIPASLKITMQGLAPIGQKTLFDGGQMAS